MLNFWKVKQLYSVFTLIIINNFFCRRQSPLLLFICFVSDTMGPHSTLHKKQLFFSFLLFRLATFVGLADQTMSQRNRRQQRETAFTPINWHAGPAIVNHASVFKDMLHKIISALSQFPGLCRYFPRWGQSSFKASSIIRLRNALSLHKLIHSLHKHATNEHLKQHTTNTTFLQNKLIFNKSIWKTPYKTTAAEGHGKRSSSALSLLIQVCKRDFALYHSFSIV